MAYRLPSPWDPGYAMPKNALDEGLERRAFTTKWTPRGTYDNPRVGNPAGYALPAYVQQEPYGQEARVTDWQPSGTYNGPKIPQWLNQRPRITNVAPAGAGRKIVTVTPAAAMAALSGVDVASVLPYAAVAGIAYLVLRKKKRK